MRAFISHTSDLAEFPEGGSFVQAALDAVGRAGLVAVDMRYFALAMACQPNTAASGYANPTLR